MNPLAGGVCSKTCSGVLNEVAPPWPALLLQSCPSHGIMVSCLGGHTGDSHTRAVGVIGDDNHGIGSCQGHSACNLCYWSQVQPSSAISYLLGITICLRPNKHHGIYLCLQSDVFSQVEELQALISFFITSTTLHKTVMITIWLLKEYLFFANVGIFQSRLLGPSMAFQVFFQKWPIVLNQLGGVE